MQRTNKIYQTQVLPYSGPPSPQQASSRLIHVVHGYLGVIGLDPRGVTCRRDSEAQVSKISKKVKSSNYGSNEGVLLFRGVHVYLQIINYVWPRHGLGPCLGCRWAWALALSSIIVGLMNLIEMFWFCQVLGQFPRVNGLGQLLFSGLGHYCCFGLFDQRCSLVAQARYLSMCMVIVIIYILDSYTDKFYGYYSARPARCGT